LLSCSAAIVCAPSLSRSLVLPSASLHLRPLTVPDAYAFYKTLCREVALPLDQQLYDELEHAASALIAEISDEIDREKDNVGPDERAGLRIKRATQYFLCGDFAACDAEIADIGDKGMTTSRRFDVQLQRATAGLAMNNWQRVIDASGEICKLQERGVDFERRNKASVLRAIVFLRQRRYAEAAELFSSALATFCASELLSFEGAVEYAVVTGIPCLNRTEYRDRVLASPEAQGVLVEDSFKQLRAYAHALNETDYATFASLAVQFCDKLAGDAIAAPHAGHLLHETLAAGFAQYLAPFSVARLSTMSEAFGVPIEVLEPALASVTASGRISARIDAVKGVVRALKRDAVTEAYRELCDKGDDISARLVKLSKGLLA
jgi:26S proteasome regulatory subunit N7